MEKCKIGNFDFKQTDNPTGSQRSEVLQSDHETNGGRSHMSGSEVTSMFSMGDLNHFPILSDMMMSGNDIHGYGMNSKWVAAGNVNGTRCNLAV